ncbi:MAG: ABC transporter ATP-binding protein [Acidimicrobiales bacterium]
MAVIEVEGLRKSYDSFVAVHDLDLSVEAGEVVAVLGPNGAGKTTTVEILEGYRSRDEGQVRVLGMDPASGGAELRQRIGIVLQECGITPYLTVAEVLHMHADCYRAPRRVPEVIELVGLQEKADARVKTLSGGQQRRLDLALGLIGDPELLFLDEPTTGFDPTARRQAWEVVRNLGSLGKTILLTTHYMDEAQVLADSVVVIAAGRVVAEGPPESIGGRAEGKVHIRFRLPADLDPAAMPVAMPVAATADGAGMLTVETDDPTTALATLTTWALERGQRLEALTVERPSLEDVYLGLTATPATPADGDTEAS